MLSLLRVGPLHPYGIQRLIREWGKDQVVNVGQRATLYKTIAKLADDGLVSVRQTERDQLYPERTVYELTAAGREQGQRWLTQMLAAPRNQFPEFPAALSFLMLLAPDQALDALEQRTEILKAMKASLRSELTQTADLARVTGIETEYQLAMVTAELSWLRSTLGDLRNGELSWDPEQMIRDSQSYL